MRGKVKEKGGVIGKDNSDRREKKEESIPRFRP